MKGVRKLTSTNSAFNAISFLIDNRIKGLVNTAIPVIVRDVDKDGGRVDVQPLVAQTDSEGNILESPIIAKLPYSRIQGGIAALKIDPVRGDIGLAVFAQQDCSNVLSELSDTVPPGSFRSYSMADGFYIGGFLNQAPEIWLELSQDNIATLHAPKKIIIETADAEIHADNSVKISCKTAEVTADVKASITTATAEVTASGAANISAPAISLNGAVNVTGALNVSGAVTAVGDVIAGKISLTTHTHISSAPGTPTGVPQ